MTNPKDLRGALENLVRHFAERSSNKLHREILLSNSKFAIPKGAVASHVIIDDGDKVLSAIDYSDTCNDCQSIGMEYVNDEPYCPFCGSCSISKREIV